MIPLAAINSQASLYRQLVHSYSPRNYWYMDIASGNLIDAGTAPYTLSAGGSPTTGQSPAIPVGSGILFDASGEYYNGTGGIFNGGTGEYAFVFFLKFSGTPGDGIIQERYSAISPYVGVMFGINAAALGGAIGYVTFIEKYTVGYYVDSTTGSLNDNVYRHYIAQRRLVSTGPDVWKLQIYIDGTLDGETTIPSVIDVTTSQTTYVGGGATRSAGLSDTLDEVAFFRGRSFSAAEALAIATAASTLS